MKIKTATKGTVELKEITVNNLTYVAHQDLKNLVRQEGVMFDFPHISTENYASAMCVVSNMQGVRCYGTGQAPSLTHAADLAFDNAVIDLYSVSARSAVELDIADAADQIKAAKAAKQKAAEEAAAKKAAEEAAAKKAAEDKKAAKEAAAKKAEKEAATKKAAEEVAAKKDAEEAVKKKAAEEAADKKAAEEAAAKKKAAEAAAKKAAEEAAKKVAEEAAAKKAAEEAAAKKAAEEAAAQKPAAQKAGYWYVEEADWIGCHSLTPNDPDDTVVDYGPFKNTGETSELRPGPKYLSQVLKYRPDFVEKLIGIQPPAFMPKVPQILTYCERHGIGLHATSGKAHDILVKYGVKEL